MKNFASLLCFLLASLFVAAPANAEIPYLNELLQSARQQRLHEQRYWEVLLHYKRGFVGTRSLIDDPKFFLSLTGKTDPQAELEATVEGFFKGEDMGDEHPMCRFVARYEWLKEKLDIDESKLPLVQCREFQEAINRINPKSAVLVFPAAHMNNPASMFGHTLIRIDSSRQSKLLSYAVNYAAVTEETNGILYAFKGIFGLYKGYFSLLPYYEKVNEYSDMDQRDMWEYSLDLSEQEVLRMTRHIWELKDIYSRYYFFDENCSYNLLFLLEAARPSMKVTGGLGLWVVPLDTVRAVEKTGAIYKTGYRPSKATRIRHMASLLEDRCQGLALAVAEQQLQPEDVLRQDCEGGEKIRILDLAAEYIQSMYSRGALSKEQYQRLFLSTLRVRGELGKQDEEYKISIPPQPEKGHPSSRFSLGLGLEDDGFFQEIRFRPVYHDLLDPDEGYVEGTQIEFGNAVFRYIHSDRKLRLENLDLINIISLSPRSRFFRPISFKLRTGFAQRVFPDGRDRLVYRLNPGGGVAFKNAFLGLYYLMFETELDLGGGFSDNYSLGAGGSLGLVRGLTDLWKAHLSASGIYYPLGEEHQAFRLIFAQRFKINSSNSITVDLSGEKIFDVYRMETTLNWNLFF